MAKPAALLHDAIAAQARRSPAACAVVLDSPDPDGPSSLTYAGLCARARCIARRLRERGVGPDVPVAICAERSPALVAGLLGILEADGAYLPLDPDHPPARLRLTVEDAQPPVVLVQPGLEERLTSFVEATRILRITDPKSDGAVDRRGADPEADRGVDGRSLDLDSEAPARRATERNLAYVLYTSGSTGRPKGVMIEHRAIMNRLQWAQETFALGPADVVLQKTPATFDVSVWEFFWPLMVGARLVLARPGGHKDPAYLADLIHRHGVTILHFVPSMLRAFLEVDDLKARCRSVRYVIASGEALPYPLTRRFYERMPESATLHNLYGPTEAAVDVSHWPVPRHPSDEVVPIGRPVANTQLYVLDPSLQPLPSGVPGELYIGGVQLARGYLNRPDLTRERFCPDPFAAGDREARLYRTGDRACWRLDGTIEFLGRLDRQVKLRGHRIELGEVEAALMRQPSVAEAAAVVRNDPNGEQRLIAYVVGRRGVVADAAGLRRALADELPDVMVPSILVALDAMPLSSSGKLDYRQLPEPEPQRAELEPDYVAPRNPLERYVADVWAEVLGVERVGVRWPFFDLGGTSLQAARVVNRIAGELNENIYVVTLFAAPTVADYAELLRKDYAEAVARKFESSDLGTADGRPARAGSAETRRRDARYASAQRRTLDAVRVARFKECVPRFVTADDPARPPADDGERNLPAIFILAPPRSGTTLLRAMLHGHGSIFAAPELNLLTFETLAQRRRALAGRHAVWLEGALRTVMELWQCDAERAKEIVDEHTDHGLTTKQFYRVLQEQIGARILADKTPAYALDPQALRKAERDFREPLYIHLVRHPSDTVRSFLEQHLDQILFLREHDCDRETLAELVWLVSHQTVLDFLQGIPANRWIRLGFEELVTDPVGQMRALSLAFGIPYDGRMVHPYEAINKKMVDGIHADSTPMGDRNFLKKREIDPSVAWRHARGDDDGSLSAQSWELAARLGYESPLREGTRDPASSAGLDRGDSAWADRVDERAALRRARLEAARERAIARALQHRGSVR